MVKSWVILLMLWVGWYTVMGKNNTRQSNPLCVALLNMTGFKQNWFIYAYFPGEVSIAWDRVWQPREVCDATGCAGRHRQMQSDSRPERDGQEPLPSVLPSPWQWEKGQGVSILFIVSILGNLSASLVHMFYKVQTLFNSSNIETYSAHVL